jgi:tetratricopeptide (TPR) repeat protein
MAKSDCQEQRLSPRARRGLLLQKEFLTGLTRRAPDYVEALESLAEVCAEAGFPREAVEADLRIVQLCPLDPFAHYNLACGHSILGDANSALACLHRALDLGYADLKNVVEDPALKELRAHPGFAKIRSRLRVLRAKED